MSELDELPTTLHNVAPESDQVRKWRRRCLVRMGVPRLESRLLAESDADLHQMLALLRHGASPDEVRRIVL